MSNTENGVPRFVRAAWVHTRRIFALRPGTDYEGSIEQVRADVEFRSGHVWALIFAIMIASVGLNVNSTAVIIGAMLISPLMGPIVGAGFAIATSDIPLLKRSLRNLLLATSIAIVSSFIYFAISPLDAAQSELLARTRPTLYDVLIATCGGAAGVVAVTRKTNKGNVIPGVAIATALMPPLCTAGFGLANGHGWFFIGALHLYLINALFICLATIAFARMMRFPKVAEIDRAHRNRVRNIIGGLTVAIAIPSGITAWSVIQEARFTQRAQQFIAENLAFEDRVILDLSYRYSIRGSRISAKLIGRRLPDDSLRAIEQRLPWYGLRGTRLELKQPGLGGESPENLTASLRERITKDLFSRNVEALAEREARIQALEAEAERLRLGEFPTTELAGELSALYPNLFSLAVAPEVRVPGAPATGEREVVVAALWRRMPSPDEQAKLQRFLKARLGVETVRVVHSVVR
ncbi:MAG TPA: DUF389 domain-containing protein [Candidatus Latescibacteria bacterium]|nr:DUF389 domain-containing protein [Candidatus Latescibacterota bacterium]